MGMLELIGRLRLDSTQFDASLRKVDSSAAKLTASLGRAFAGALSVGAVTQQVRKTVEYASTIDDLSKATGLAADRVQELDFAMKQNGATVQDAARAARHLAEARAEALKNPRGDKAAAFEKFGIAQPELSGLSDPGALLYRFSAALKGVNVDANSLPAILDLIGAKGSAAIPALTQGLQELSDQARQAGLIMSNETVAALDAVGDKWDELGKRITVGVAPAIQYVLDLFGRVQDRMEIGFTGIFAVIEKIKSSDFAGKNAMTIWRELFDAAGVAAVEAEGDQAVAALERRLARQQIKKQQLPAEAEKMLREAGPAVGRYPGQRLGSFRASSDSLVSVGNRLGEDPNSRAAMQKIDEIRQSLKNIEQATRRTRAFGNPFPSS